MQGRRKSIFRKGLCGNPMGVSSGGSGRLVGQGMAGHFARGKAAGNRDDRPARRLFRAPRAAGRRRDAISLSPGRRWGVSRPGLALAARGRASAFGTVLSAVVRLVGCRVAGSGPRRSRDLRIARRHVYAGRDIRCRRAAIARTGGVGHYGDRADADRPIPRRARLGLRRRLSLRRPEQLRRAAGAATAGRCRPSARPGGDSRRGLQPSWPRGKLLRAASGRISRRTTTPPGARPSITTDPTATPCGSSSSTMPAVGSAISISTGCGSTPCRRSTTSARGTSWPTSRPPCKQRSPGRQRPVYVIAETDQNDVRLVAPPERGGYGLDGVWSDDFHHSVHALLTGEHDGYYADFGSPRAGGQSPERRLCLRWLLQPLSPPPPRHPRRRTSSGRGLSSACRTTIRSATAPWASGYFAGAACRAATGDRLALAFALRAAAVYGRRIRRAEPVCVLLLVRRSALVEAVRRGRRESSLR